MSSETKGSEVKQQKQKLVVVIFGRKQAGKNTVANYLAEAFVRKGLSVQQIGFADPVKEVAMHLLGMPLEVAYGGEKERNSWTMHGKTARQWLQFVGTELGREINSDLWVERAADTVGDSSCDVVLLTDGRFENEARLSDQMEPGEDWKVCNVLVGRDSLPNEDAHASEAAVDQIDRGLFQVVIQNNTSLAWLKLASRELAEVVAGGSWPTQTSTPAPAPKPAPKPTPKPTPAPVPVPKEHDRSEDRVPMLKQVTHLANLARRLAQLEKAHGELRQAALCQPVTGEKHGEPADWCKHCMRPLEPSGSNVIRACFAAPAVDTGKVPA